MIKFNRLTKFTLIFKKYVIDFILKSNFFNENKQPKMINSIMKLSS